MTALSGHLLSFQGHRVAVQGTQARPWAARNRSNRILPILGQTPIQGLSSGCPIGRSAASAGEKVEAREEAKGGVVTVGAVKVAVTVVVAMAAAEMVVVREEVEKVEVVMVVAKEAVERVVAVTAEVKAVVREAVETEVETAEHHLPHPHSTEPHATPSRYHTCTTECGHHLLQRDYRLQDLMPHRSIASGAKGQGRIPWPRPNT